jgi:hypothetical protein
MPSFNFVVIVIIIFKEVKTMPVNSNRGGIMPNSAPQFGSGAAQHSDAVQAINQLTYAALWSGPQMNPISQTTWVRIDVQNAPGGGAQNLQAQLNGLRGHSTVATVIIAGNLALAGNSIPRQKEVLRTVKSAFFDSLNDFEQGNPHIWNVGGNFSN